LGHLEKLEGCKYLQKRIQRKSRESTAKIAERYRESLGRWMQEAKVETKGRKKRNSRILDEMVVKPQDL
jgi:hypothetical protein